MSGDPTFFGDALTLVGTSKLHDLGTIRVENNATYGRQVWRYILSAGTLTAGLAVKRNDSVNIYQGILSTAGCPRASLLGVAQHTIASGSYGWIQWKGFGTVYTTAGVTANTGLEAVAAGVFADGVIGTDDITAYSGALIAATSSGIALLDFP